VERLYRTASSILVYPEARAALAAARRADRLAEGDYEPAISDFETRFDDLIKIGIDDDLAKSAGTQAEIFCLRGYDAVHLASALGLGEVTLVTWDEELAEAAESAGLPVAGARSSLAVRAPQLPDAHGRNRSRPRSPKRDAKPPTCGGFPMRLNGVEPSRVFPPTRPSTLRVYQFRHSRLRGRRF
jgi:uncharacterized protein